MVKYMNMTSDEIDAEIAKIEKNLAKIQNMNTLTSKDFDKQTKKIKQLKKKVNDLICVLEVEHFLEAGPEGKDPI
jgi:polyhydroxyalkanoate synthesis regulator phasin